MSTKQLRKLKGCLVSLVGAATCCMNKYPSEQLSELSPLVLKSNAETSLFHSPSALLVQRGKSPKGKIYPE